MTSKSGPSSAGETSGANSCRFWAFGDKEPRCRRRTIHLFSSRWCVLAKTFSINEFRCAPMPDAEQTLACAGLQPCCGSCPTHPGWADMEPARRERRWRCWGAGAADDPACLRRHGGTAHPCPRIAGLTEILPIDCRCEPVVGDLRQRLGVVKRRVDRHRV
jgi:hypothetical protein